MELPILEREAERDPLIVAVRGGDGATVDRLLSAEPARVHRFTPEPRPWGEEQWLPLHHAAAVGDLAMVDRLLGVGASPDGRTRFRTPMHARATSLHHAAAAGFAPGVRRLLEKGAEPNARDAEDAAPLHGSAEAGDAEAVAALLEFGARVDVPDAYSRTPLHAAIAAESENASAVQAVVNALIAAGADVDRTCPRDPTAYTPLHRCVSRGPSRAGVATLLLRAGADRSTRDPQHGRTPGQLAAELGVADAFAMLRDAADGD